MKSVIQNIIAMIYDRVALYNCEYLHFNLDILQYMKIIFRNLLFLGQENLMSNIMYK